MSLLDRVINEVDGALRTLMPPKNRITQRISPADAIPDIPLSLADKKHIAGLMRVNHSGEVCAQALYQGQALTAKLKHIKEHMTKAALEETDHLAWCEKRLAELGSHTSWLNPFWYGGSLVLGAFAGLLGDNISLGFVAETERQVSAHLQSHIEKLPMEEQKTKAILQLMQEDEAHHAQWALNSGGAELPGVIKLMMTMVSRVMTRSSYYL